MEINLILIISLLKEQTYHNQTFKNYHAKIQI